MRPNPDQVTGVWTRAATTGVAHVLIWGISAAAWTRFGIALPSAAWLAGAVVAAAAAACVLGWRWLRVRRLRVAAPDDPRRARGLRESVAASAPLMIASACLGGLFAGLGGLVPIRGLDVVLLCVAIGVVGGGVAADGLDRRRGVVVVRRDPASGGRGLVACARAVAS